MATDIPGRTRSGLAAHGSQRAGPLDRPSWRGRRRGRFPVAKRLLRVVSGSRWWSTSTTSARGAQSSSTWWCAGLLLHLRDPMRALERIRAVCRGARSSRPSRSTSRSPVLQPRRGVAARRHTSELFSGRSPTPPHVRMLATAGFEPGSAAGPTHGALRSRAPTPPRPARARSWAPAGACSPALTAFRITQRWRGSSAPGRIRTCDFCLRRAALYPLSYGRSERRV